MEIYQHYQDTETIIISNKYYNQIKETLDHLDNKIGVFVSQAETAVSYNKFDDKIDGILVKMIDEICLDRERISEIVDEAVGKIEKLKSK